MKIAYIEWLDACSQEGPVTLEDFSEDGLIIQSVGILAKETKTTISIAQDLTSKKYRNVLHIPRKYIKVIKINNLKK